MGSSFTMTAATGAQAQELREILSARVRLKITEHRPRWGWLVGTHTRFTVTGPPEAVAAAQGEVQDLLRRDWLDMQP
jgi:hypothetical protein